MSSVLCLMLWLAGSADGLWRSRAPGYPIGGEAANPDRRVRLLRRPLNRFCGFVA